MAAVFFFFAAIGAVGGALGTVMLRDAFYSVLALVTHLIFLAMLFLLLRAEFVAAAQVIVYAGAVMVLYVFVVAYIGGADEPLRPESGGVAMFGPVFALGQPEREHRTVVEPLRRPAAGPGVVALPDRRQAEDGDLPGIPVVQAVEGQDLTER